MTSQGKNNKFVYIAAFVLLLGGLAFLVFQGVKEESAYFVDVGEALSMDAEKLGSARLFGVVDEGGISPHQDAPGVDFTILDQKDPAKSLRVAYTGPVPDTFKAGVEVIIEGGLDSGNNIFEATSLTTKCPSKYQKENRES